MGSTPKTREIRPASTTSATGSVGRPATRTPMAISRRLGGAALAFAAGFASAARAQDPAAVIRAALGTDAMRAIVDRATPTVAAVD